MTFSCLSFADLSLMSFCSLIMIRWSSGLSIWSESLRRARSGNPITALISPGPWNTSRISCSALDLRRGKPRPIQRSITIGSRLRPCAQRWQCSSTVRIHGVMGHPLEDAFVYSTFTDDSKGKWPKTSRTREAEEANQPNKRLVEKKKRTVFNIVKLPNKCKSVLTLC